MSSASGSQSKTDSQNKDSSAAEQRKSATGALPAVDQTPNLKAIIGGALQERWKKVLKQTKKAKAVPTERAVHDLRVALRRFIAALDIVGTIMPKSGAEKLRSRLRVHLKALSALRDTQVQILRVGTLLKDYPELSRLLKSLKARESAQIKRARKEIVKIAPDSMQSIVEKLLSRTDSLLSTASTQENAYSVLKGMLAGYFIRTVALRDEIRSDMHQRLDRIHKLRLVFKRFRYSVEILQPIFPRVSDSVIRNMSDYQSSLGMIHDTAVLVSVFDTHLKKLTKKRSKRRTSYQDWQQKLQSSLRQSLEENVKSFVAIMDQVEEFWDHMK